MADGNSVEPSRPSRDVETRREPRSSDLLVRQGGPGAALSVAVLLALVLALYWRTTLSMVSIWERSETFAHGFAVIPIFLYLVWRQRGTLARIELKPCLPALLGVVAAGATWLVGELVSAIGVSQMAMVAMVPFSVWAVLGTRVAGTLGIPLAFLFFAVPFGEFLVPTLMDRTADVAILAIRASGVPVYREGNYFMIPSGRWSVVEACSGLRYLIASFMVGSLYAYLSYRSTFRRVAFIVASILVPIVANWARAYMIVMLGHLSSNRIAVGVDHLIYGWIFFGVVMAFLFWIGSRWREDDKPDPGAEPSNAPNIATARPDRHLWAATLAAVVLTAIWQPLYAGLAREGKAGRIELAPITGRNGWEAVPDPLSAWRPDVKGARAELRQSFVKEGQRVGLHVAFFIDQTPEAKAITSQNQLVNTTNNRWKRIGDGAVSAAIGERTFDLRTGVVTDERERLAAWQWFWVDGRVTSSDYLAKLYQALSVLRGRGDPVAWVIVYTPTDGGEAKVRTILQGFATDMLIPIDTALRQASAP